jgi:hypothetical protein
LENERLWKEENAGEAEAQASDLSDIGAKAPGELDMDLASDLETAVPVEAPAGEVAPTAGAPTAGPATPAA